MAERIGATGAKATKVINLADEGWLAFSADDVEAVLKAVGLEYSSNVDRTRLERDLSNDFMTFAVYRASAANFSARTRKAIDGLATAASRVKLLYEAALAEPAQLTWLMSKAWKIDVSAESKLTQIRDALRNLDLIMASDDSVFRKYKPGLSYEVQFIGVTLPYTYEKHFTRPFATSRKSDQNPSGPGIRFILACLQQKHILNSDGRPFAAETIISHHKLARKQLRKDPRLRVARAPVFIPKDTVVAGEK